MIGNPFHNKFFTFWLSMLAVSVLTPLALRALIMLSQS